MQKTNTPVSPHLRTLGALLVALLLLGFLLFAANTQKEQRLRDFALNSGETPGNLVDNFLDWTPGITSTVGYRGWEISGTVRYDVASSSAYLEPLSVITSGSIPVQPGNAYMYSFNTQGSAGPVASRSQLRLLWLGPTLDVAKPLSWNDVPTWLDTLKGEGSDAWSFRSGSYTAPNGATSLRLILNNVGTGPLRVNSPVLTQEGLHVEPNPNGTEGSIAFSFDWESAMGGAVHSKGETQHDAQAAAKHGSEMRQGADWLRSLFTKYGIKATFYATGYNLLDGNVEKRTFSGDPIYKWASPKNRWENNWWVTHKWFSDDPFGTYQTQPAWYFGDQTRTLMAAGHEIASHTFAHIYVRGSNPTELSTDMDQWFKVAQAQGITGTTTFAFPWRSSNSLTADFYDVLYKRGIRAVTRLYDGDLKDLYAIGAVPVYPDIAVMPDFLLGAPSVNAGDEAAGGSVIGIDKGLEVITETLARRGTTSFWTHPEQLADGPAFTGGRAAWEGVVEAAAVQRDKGRLWIGTVAQITAYQRDVMSVTTTLEPGFLRLGSWKITVCNASGNVLHGVTLTLPGDAQRVSSQIDVQTVYHPSDGSTALAAPGKAVYPARQLVFPSLPVGTSTISVDWVTGQEPLQ